MKYYTLFDLRGTKKEDLTLIEFTKYNHHRRDRNTLNHITFISLSAIGEQKKSENRALTNRNITWMFKCKGADPYLRAHS